MNRSLRGIGYDRKPCPLLLLSTILEHMCLTIFSDNYNPPLNTVELMVSKFFTFHENKELLPFGDCFDVFPGNNDPTNHIMHVLFVISVGNQRVWVEVAKED